MEWRNKKQKERLTDFILPFRILVQEFLEGLEFEKTSLDHVQIIHSDDDLPSEMLCPKTFCGSSDLRCVGQITESLSRDTGVAGENPDISTCFVIRCKRGGKERKRKEWMKRKERKGRNGWMGWKEGTKRKEWMNQSMDESMNGWMKEWMKERMKEWVNGWMNKRTNERMDGCMDEWGDEWMDESTNKWRNKMKWIPAMKRIGGMNWGKMDGSEGKMNRSKDKRHRQQMKRKR